MAFTFRYQKVLDVREKQQRSLEVELGRLDRALLDGRAHLARWDQTRRDVLAQLREARERGDVEQNAHCSRYLRYVRRRLALCRESLADLESQREAARQRLLEAMKSRKVLENYRDKLKAEYVAAQEKAEERVAELHSALSHIRSEGTP